MPRRQDIEQLINQKQRRLQKLKEQQAIYGHATESHILLEIEDIEADLTTLAARAAALAELPRLNPYRGLAAFREKDEAFFFGREDFTGQLVDGVQQKPLITVVGPSGSGKSSVVFAGLIPRLREKNHWLIAHFRPGHDPFRNLAGALLPLYEPGLDKTDQMAKTPKLAAYLLNGQLSVSDLVTNILQTQSQARRLLVIVDQFEELYTLCANQDHQQPFLDVLLRALPFPPGAAVAQPLHFVLTLRADFLGQALGYPPFGDALQGAIELLRPMNLDEMRRVIEQPAASQDVGFETGLVDRILTAVSDEPGKLPLLEFALTAMWDQRDGDNLTHATYNSVGQVGGALSKYADRFYNDELVAAEQQRARRIFVQMVRPGNGTENTRCLARRKEMTDPADWDLVQKLATARLVVTNRDPEGEEVAEIIHEALIQGWDRLHRWMTMDRTFRLWQERLRFALRQWQATDKDEGALLRGAALGEAEAWLADRESDLSPIDRQYIRAGLDLRESEEARKRAQQQRELDQQRALTEEQRKRARVMAVAGIIALILAMVALGFGVQSQRKAIEAQSLALAANARQALSENNTDQAIALALEANNIGQPLPVVRGALAASAYYAPGTRRQLVGHTERVTSVAFNPRDGRSAVSGSADDSLIVWNLETGEIVRRLTGHAADVNGVAFSPDGRTILSGSSDGSLILWEAQTGQVIRRLSGHAQAVNSVAIDPTGRFALSGSDSGQVIVWNLASGAEVYRRDCVARVTTVRFSPDGRLFAAGTQANAVYIWTTETGELYRHKESAANRGVTSIALSPDNNSILIGAAGYGPGIFQLKTATDKLTQIQALGGHSGGNTQVALSADGQLAVTGADDNQLILWNIADLPLTGDRAGMWRLTGHTDDVTSVAFSPDDRQVLSGSADTTLRLWDISSGAEMRRFSGFVGFAVSADGHTVASSQDGLHPVLLDIVSSEQRRLEGDTGPLISLAFSPDNHTVFSGDWMGRVHRWDIDQATLRQSFALHPNGVTSIAIGPDGQYGLSGSYGPPPNWSGDETLDDLLLLWDAETGQVRQRFVGHEGVVRCVAISSDGQLALSGADDTTVRLWDTKTGEMLRKFTGHSSPVKSVIFGPNDKTVISASEDQTIRIWNIETGQEKQRLVGHTMAILSIALSPDKKTIVSGSDDGSIRFWNIEAGFETAHIAGLPLKIWNVAFGFDESVVLSRSKSDNTIRLWKIDPPTNLIQWTCENRYVRELTCAERQQYGIKPLCDERGTPPASKICQSVLPETAPTRVEDKNESYLR